MNSVYVILQKIRKMPGIYIGIKNIDYLLHCINGYKYRIMDESPNHQWSQDCLDGFFEFVVSFYNTKAGTLNWNSIILQNTDSQEEAFDKFFELFDVFLDQKGISLN